MIYAKIENELVTKILCGEIETDNTFISLPDNTDVYVGVNIGEIRDGYLIPLWERIEKGFIIIPDGYTFDGTNIVKIEEPIVEPEPTIIEESIKEPESIIIEEPIIEPEPIIDQAPVEYDNPKLESLIEMRLRELAIDLLIKEGKITPDGEII